MPFVSFEGVDGAGKTTQLRRTAQWLAESGVHVVRTKEPDGGRIGTAIRAILASDRAVPLSATEELLLVSAARYDHVRSVVRPALAVGAWVLSDRFYDSTYALQVHGTHAWLHCSLLRPMPLWGKQGRISRLFSTSNPVWR